MTEKRCFKCGDTKPLDSFYKHPMMADGHLNKCAECTRADTRANRAARIEYYQAYDRNRARSPERIRSKKDRPQAHRRESDPVKREARNRLNNAIRDGKIKKPPECQICAVCDDRLHGHHEDYTRPLEVIWVCAACHAFVHSYLRARERIAA